MSNGTCAIATCEKPTRTPSADLCDAHYMRRYRHGDPLWERPRSGRDLTGQRFGALTAICPVAGEGWRCVCDCGGERVARTFALLNADYPTCDAPLHRRELYAARYGPPKGVKRHDKTCQMCNVNFVGWKSSRFCTKSCAARWSGARRGFRSPHDPRVKRQYRDRAAAGLAEHERAKLRAKWKRQGKPCAYCGGYADTIDHVVPLIRGGSNYEGNLVMACRRCNSSKSGRTVTGWRAGRVQSRARAA